MGALGRRQGFFDLHNWMQTTVAGTGGHQADTVNCLLRNSMSGQRKWPWKHGIKWRRTGDGTE